MFLDPKPKSKLEIAIDDVLTEMERYPPTSEEYVKLLGILSDLEKMRQKPNRPSADVMIQSAVHILGVAMIIRHEQFNIITSKALGFVPRIR